MKFPYLCKEVSHKAGGKVTHIYGIEHMTDKPKDGFSRDYWYYVGRVEWHDGSKSEQSQINPMSLCQSSEAGKKEIHQLSDMLALYLTEHGRWCDSDSGHNGWYATVRRKGT